MAEPATWGHGETVWSWCQRGAALVLLLLFAPVMLLLAVGVAATSPGPAIFRQQRIGQFGRRFTVLKFRTMAVGAHEQRLDLMRSHGVEPQPFLKLVDDPRVTRLGAVLRRTSLDELPQLVNVVRGEMNLVGPRPLTVVESSLCPEEHWRRLLVRPGITGLWQVGGRSDVDAHAALRLDDDYVRQWTPGLDVRLLLKTLVVPFKGHGVY